MVSAQDTLTETRSYMYGKKYILSDTSNDFLFYYNHCNGITLGHGTYKKMRKRLVFHFDTTIKMPQKKVVCKDNTVKDSITIELISDSPDDLICFIDSATQAATCHSPDTFKIPKPEGAILVQPSFTGTLFSINPTYDHCFSYNIRIPKHYTYKGVDRVKMKKTRNNSFRCKARITRYRLNYNSWWEYILAKRHVTYYYR